MRNEDTVQPREDFYFFSYYNRAFGQPVKKSTLSMLRIYLGYGKLRTSPLFRSSFHTLHQDEPRRSGRCKFSKKRTKSITWLNPPNVKPKVYMRQTIANIYKLLKYSTWDDAENQLKNLPIRWDSFTVNQVLKAHPPMEKAWLFFVWVSKMKDFKLDQFTCTTMLDIFGEAGRISSMKYIFQMMNEHGIEIDVVTYTSIMHWVSRSGDVEGAMRIWEEMKQNGCSPTVVTYTCYMNILFDAGRIKEAVNAFKDMLENKIYPNCHTYTVIMKYLVDAGKCEEALEIFGQMQEAALKPDKAACNVLIEKCCRKGETRAMNQILQYMKDNFIVLRRPIFLEALKTYQVANESDALLRQVHPHMSLECIHTNEEVESAVETFEDLYELETRLVLLFLKRRNLSAVDVLLSGLMLENVKLDFKLDSALISSIIELNCCSYRHDGAILALRYSEKVGVNLGKDAYLACIGVLMRSCNYVGMVEVVEKMVKTGQSLGAYQSSLLIYKLGCARRPLLAVKIFNLLPDDHKSVATYTALISAYFSAGSAEKGLQIYKTMVRKGIHPSLGTYSVIVAGLEKLGKTSKVESYRKAKGSLLKDVRHCDTTEKVCDLLFGGAVLP